MYSRLDGFDGRLSFNSCHKILVLHEGSHDNEYWCERFHYCNWGYYHSSEISHRRQNITCFLGYVGALFPFYLFYRVWEPLNSTLPLKTLVKVAILDQTSVQRAGLLIIHWHECIFYAFFFSNMDGRLQFLFFFYFRGLLLGILWTA